MNKIAFTLCSNNYLAHAKTLGDSLIKFNPDIHFVIGLTDKFNKEIDYDFFKPHEIVVFESIGFGDFNEMIAKYNIIEFNTSVKPFYFEYFFSRYGTETSVFYFDPDIECYGELDQLLDILSVNNFLLTPHITEPQFEVGTLEPTILNVGVYNLGFMGIRNSVESLRFLKWWQRRLRDFCFIDQKRGLFVDQIWVNLLPVLFEGVHIIKSPSYNMACWNLQERKLLRLGNKYFVNDEKHPLVFFHFSGFNPNNPRYITRVRKPEFLLDSLADLKELFEKYSHNLRQNNFDFLTGIKPSLDFKSQKVKSHLRQRIGRSLKFRVNKYLKVIFGV